MLKLLGAGNSRNGDGCNCNGCNYNGGNSNSGNGNGKAREIGGGVAGPAVPGPARLPGGGGGESFVRGGAPACAATPRATGSGCP